jgi:hypothetical protein
LHALDEEPSSRGSYLVLHGMDELKITGNFGLLFFVVFEEL